MSSQINKKEQLDKARELYLSYRPRKEIAELTGLNESTIKYHISSTWLQEREIQRVDLIKSLETGKNFSILNIGKLSLQLVENTLVEWTKQGKKLEMGEVLALSKIGSEMDKILKLRESTQEVSKQVEMTEAQVAEIMKMDPFYISHDEGTLENQEDEKKIDDAQVLDSSSSPISVLSQTPDEISITYESGSPDITTDEHLPEEGIKDE